MLSSKTMTGMSIGKSGRFIQTPQGMIRHGQDIFVVGWCSQPLQGICQCHLSGHLSQLYRCWVGIVKKVGITRSCLLPFAMGIHVAIVCLMGQLGNCLATVFANIEYLTFVSSPSQVIQQFASNKRFAAGCQCKSHNNKCEILSHKSLTNSKCEQIIPSRTWQSNQHNQEQFRIIRQIRSLVFFVVERIQVVGCEKGCKKNCANSQHTSNDRYCTVASSNQSTSLPFRAFSS